MSRRLSGLFMLPMSSLSRPSSRVAKGIDQDQMVAVDSKASRPKYQVRIRTGLCVHKGVEALRHRVTGRKVGIPLSLSRSFSFLRLPHTLCISISPVSSLTGTSCTARLPIVGLAGHHAARRPSAAPSRSGSHLFALLCSALFSSWYSKRSHHGWLWGHRVPQV